MKQKEKDEKFAAHMPGVLEYHRLMLGDATRNQLLLQAIERSMTPETSFLDIGAGTGVWAILAAKLGAKRVVAVEIEECLIPIIYKHAQENGVADRIEIIHGKSDDVKIGGKFDVIVSELFGGDAFGPETVKSFIDIRERFLTPGGILIPQKLTMLATPVWIEQPDTPAGLTLKTDFLRSIGLNHPQTVMRTERTRVKFLDKPREIVELDFRSITEPPSLAGLSASWHLDDISKANAIATYNRSIFLDGIEMDSIDSQSWGVGIYEFVPFEKQGGELELSLTIEPKNTNWSVSAPSNPDIRPQTYSPVFAFARVRMAQKMTPHRKFKPPRQQE